MKYLTRQVLDTYVGEEITVELYPLPIKEKLKGILQKTDNRYYHLKTEEPQTGFDQVGNPYEKNVTHFLVSHVHKAWWQPRGNNAPLQLPVGRDIVLPKKEKDPQPTTVAPNPPTQQRIIFVLIFEDGTENLYTVKQKESDWEFENQTDSFTITYCLNVKEVVEELKAEWKHLAKVTVIIGERFLRTQTFIVKGDK